MPTVRQVLEAEWREFSRPLRPLPSTSPRSQALAAPRPARGGGTNYLAWLHVRLFLEQSR